MEWIWAGQATLLMMVSALAFLLWRVQRRLGTYLAEDRVTAGLNVLEARLQEWDGEARDRKEKIVAQLRILQRICDKAKEILEQNQTQGASQAISVEENELKALASEPALPDETQSIPTLQQVEETKKRLKQEMALDLRSLLREQLA
jgi:hypothetical protein